MFLFPTRCISAIVFWALTLSLTHSSYGEDLILAPAETPMYQLSNFRTEGLNLVFDFKRTRAGKTKSTSVRLGGKAKTAMLQVYGTFPKKESGTFRLQVRIGAGGQDYELYLKSSAPLGKSYLVSNVIRMGNPGPVTRARAFTVKEKESIARAILAATPPTGIPSDFEAVEASTELVAGMPMKAGRDAKWHDAEVISFEKGGKVTVKFSDTNELKQLLRKDWLAVSTTVLREARRDPGQFSPSVNVLPGGGVLEIPDGSIPLPADVAFPKGTPLQLEYHHSKWHNVFVIKDDGETIKLRYEGYYSNWDESKSRNEFIVSEKTLEELKSPESIKRFAANLEPAEKESSTASTSSATRGGSKKIRHKRYRVSIDVPRGAKFVPDDVVIEKGTPLAACYARKWNPITAISENEDGSLHVHWDDYSDAWNCDMLRSELIIQNKTLAKLKKKSTEKEVAETSNSVDLKKLKAESRTWTDSTGKHKVEAVYDSHTDTEVTLKSSAGKVIKMPLDRLSEKDRDLISRIGAEADNPFETFSK